ncbi:MAG: hypothetical protein MZU79_03250 [Anaerotruncus sp.]|nr:hypothetical protein [Anaerotruncus sp.]
MCLGELLVPGGRGPVVLRVNRLYPHKAGRGELLKEQVGTGCAGTSQAAAPPGLLTG